MFKVLLVFLFISFLTLPLFAQSIDTAWVRKYSYSPSDSSIEFGFDIAIDGLGNIYVVGLLAWNYGGPHPPDRYLTIKYFPNGDTAWVRTYNDGSGKGAIDIALGSAGNVYVAGEAGIIKYNAEGDQLWVRPYASRAIALNAFGNIYVTGNGTAKYDNDGNQLWAVPNGGTDIGLDSVGNIYVHGGGITTKYYPNGDTAWVRTDSLASYFEFTHNMVADAAGNVYIAGDDGGCACTKLYTNGETAWFHRYCNGGEAMAITTDGFGNAYLTGNCNDDLVTVKYDSVGNELWARSYDGPAHGFDRGYAVAVGLSGNVYVVGLSNGGATNYDYITLKYDLNGNELWTERFSTEGSGEDYGFALALDSSSNVYVTGTHYMHHVYTIKYIQFVRGDANGDSLLTVSDVVYQINYLFKGGVTPEPSPIVADCNCDGKVSVSDVIYLINYLFKGGPSPAC